MHRISNTWELAKASARVLKADKELVVLPIISSIASLIVAASFLLPIFIAGDPESPSTVFYIVAFVVYFVTAYITIFFNAALVHAANERMNGGDPTVGSAIRGAAARAGKILPWALISATVSVILRALEERAGILGRIVIGLVGLAWTLVTFLVLPIVVIEGESAVASIKKSANLFKRTWGENVAAQIGFGLLGFLLALPGIGLIVLGVASGTAAVAIAGIAVGVVWLIGVAVTMAALNGIFQTALYHFAVSGSVPGRYFDERQLNSAFGPRSGPRMFR